MRPEAGVTFSHDKNQFEPDILMRPTSGFVLGALCSTALGALEVDFVTSRGTITAELDYVQAPLASANLVALAEGSRKWVDSRNGAVKSEPFFAGLDFHEVIDDSGGKLIATGSRTGDGSDVPGYFFPDEFDPALTHEPYVLAMANLGPNTNGSVLYFTGDSALPERDGVNTVFGSVSGAPSRAVIDAIIAAGPGTTTVESVEVRRTGQAALDFDIHAVGLPVVTGVTPDLRVVPGSSTEALAGQPSNSVLQAHGSADLSVWAPKYYHQLVGLDDTPPGPVHMLDGARQPRFFYQFSLVEYSGVAGSSTFADQVLTLRAPGTGRFVYSGDGTGLAGTYQNIIPDPFLGEIVLFEGSFVVRDEIPAQLGPYSFEILLYLFNATPGGSPFHHIRGGYDDVQVSLVEGRHLTDFLNPLLGFEIEDGGPLELTRP